MKCADEIYPIHIIIIPPIIIFFLTSIYLISHLFYFLNVYIFIFCYNLLVQSIF